MMHNPIVDGTIFETDWIRYKKLPRLSKYEMLVCYTDQRSNKTDFFIFLSINLYI